MNQHSLDLFDRHALLFLPASNPRAIMHARESAADIVILDLEDAVADSDKAEARSAAVAAVAQPWKVPVAIRINGPDTDWHGQDIVALIRQKPDLVVVPGVETREELAFVRNQTGLPVVAMIETARGVLNAAMIAPEAHALIAGTNDLAADLRLPGEGKRQAMQMALQSIVLAARAAGIAVFDGVFNGFEDVDGFMREAEESRRLGFDGKSLIHPRQIAPCREAFAPSAEELDRAERLISAFSGGAERFEGAMIEQMHVDSARRLVERYRR